MIMMNGQPEVEGMPQPKTLIRAAGAKRKGKRKRGELKDQKAMYTCIDLPMTKTIRHWT